MQIFQPLQWFILLLQKGVYPYEYMDVWEDVNETSLSQKKIKKNKKRKEKGKDINQKNKKWVGQKKHILCQIFKITLNIS